MKLRNKMTGEIGELAAYDASKEMFAIKSDDKTIYYFSLASLCEDWEDYTPTEPLIKDEKIRKAVRAWANADLIKKAYLEDDYTICANDDVNVRISFSLPVFKDVGGAIDYTIAELCGEEEE